MKLDSPDTITATYETITPMFIGDANKQPSAIFPQSFKGALRFWWRALVWGGIRELKETDEDALVELHKQEAELFGSSAIKTDEQNVPYGKGLISIKINNISKKEILDENQLLNEYPLSNNSGGYALGLGLSKYNRNIRGSVYTRRAIKSGFQFKVEIIFNKDTDEEHLKNIRASLILLGFLGGLGSKSRRGLGSVSITDLSFSKKFSWNKEFHNEEKTLLNLLKEKKLNGILSSQKAEILIKKHNNKNAWDVLCDMNNDMQIFRSRGRKVRGVHRINGIEANHQAYEEKNTDHKLVCGFLKDTENLPKKLPTSLSFGLPRTYLMSDENSYVSIKFESRNKDKKSKSKRSRRASPVLMHVHKLSSDSFLSIQTVFHGKLFPECDEISVSKKNSNDKSYKEITSISLKGYQSDILSKYIDYLKNNGWVILGDWENE